MLEFSQLGAALHASRRKILVFLSFVLMVVLVMGTVMHVVEGPEHGFTTIPVSVYWAITTMTTVGYSDELRTHHHIEDDIMFPQLLARVPDYAVYSDSLAGDHHQLDRMIDGLREALVDWAAHTTDSDAARDARFAALDLAVELRDFLEEHLAIEDADVLPMVHRNFTFEEYAELEKQAGKAITIRQAFFTAPWYMATVDAETAARTWREAPIALKVIHVLARRSYARLAAKAFGARP